MKYTIDATNKRLGNLAQEVAKVLMGKDSVDFAKNTIADVQVLIENAEKLDITDKKKDEKYYLTYSGFPGGQKKEFLGHLIERKGIEEAIVRAVSRMLPKNKLRDRMLLNIEITK
jgi:large subunit ribosomal protein L13